MVRFSWLNGLTCCNIKEIIFPGGLLSKTGSTNGDCFGNVLHDQLLRRRPPVLHDLSRALDVAFVQAALKDVSGDRGRDPWDPASLFNMVFCQFRSDLSDRRLEERAPGT